MCMQVQEQSTEKVLLSTTQILDTIRAKFGNREHFWLMQEPTDYNKYHISSTYGYTIQPLLSELCKQIWIL